MTWTTRLARGLHDSVKHASPSPAAVLASPIVFAFSASRWTLRLQEVLLRR